jgi:hypothetical protein
MNKTIFIVTLLISASLSTVVVGEEDYPILDRQIEIRQAHLAWRYAQHEIGISACIDYIYDISNGSVTTELSFLLQDLQNQIDLIETVTTHVGLNNAIRQIKSITTDFRLELRDQIHNYGGKGIDLLSTIQTAILYNESYLNSLEDQYWDIKKTNDLEIFDIRVLNGQNILNRLGQNGNNVTNSQAKLDEIKDKRSELEDALDQRDYNEIGIVLREIFELSKELRQIVRDLQIDIPLSLRARFWIRVGERVFDRTSTIISELERLGIETTQLEQIHSKAQNNLSLAKTKYESGDINGSIDALHDLKSNFIELKDVYLELIFGGELTETLETAVELTSDALEKTIDEMDKTI